MSNSDYDIVEAGNWAAYTRDYFGPKRWSSAHFFVDGDDVPLCGRGPRDSDNVEWANEADASYPERCACCARRLEQSRS